MLLFQIAYIETLYLIRVECKLFDNELDLLLNIRPLYLIRVECK